MRQHACAYVSIRQHTSANVSMRQHTRGAPEELKRKHADVIIDEGERDKIQERSEALGNRLKLVMRSAELCQLRQLRQVGRDAFDLIRVHRHDRDLRQELDVRGDYPQIVSVDVHPCDVGRVLHFCRTRRSMRQHTSAYASIRQHTSA